MRNIVLEKSMADSTEKSLSLLSCKGPIETNGMEKDAYWYDYCNLEQKLGIYCYYY